MLWARWAAGVEIRVVLAVGVRRVTALVVAVEAPRRFGLVPEAVAAILAARGAGVLPLAMGAEEGRHIWPDQ